MLLYLILKYRIHLLFYLFIFLLFCMRNFFRLHFLFNKLNFRHWFLRQHRFFEETRRQIIECRQWTAEQLARRGFELTDSKANFLFARTDAMPGPELFRRLWQQGVLVRRFDTPSRIGDWLRITVGTLEQMEKVLDAVDTALKGEC